MLAVVLRFPAASASLGDLGREGRNECKRTCSEEGAPQLESAAIEKMKLDGQPTEMQRGPHLGE